MATENDELIRILVDAYSRLHPSMREQMVWRMNLATFKDIAKARVSNAIDPIFALPPIMALFKIPEGTTLLGMRVEEHKSREILLVMKVK